MRELMVGQSVSGGNLAALPPVRERPRPRVAALLRRAFLHESPTRWAYVDLALIALATHVAYRLLVFDNPEYDWVVSQWLAGAAFCACIPFAGIIFGLYERQTLMARSRILVRSCMSLALGVTLAYACLSVFFYAEVSRWLGVLVALTYLGVGVPLRVAAHELVTARRIHVLCIGNSASIRQVVALLGNGHRLHFKVVGHVASDAAVGTARDAGFDRACPRLGTTDQLGRIIDEYHVDQVIVGAELTSDAAVGAAILACLERHCRVADQPTFVEKLQGEVPAENITAQWFLLADVQASDSYEAIKRIMDVVAALIGLALTLPVWLLIAAAIRLDNPGPAIFRQRRVGLHGRPFDILKFRTMRLDAERDGPRWAERNDTRVTRLGRFLRRSRLDELPQLWNILTGDMALVGPRPERPEFVEQLAHQLPNYRQRHLIKPGLTGWAQIHYGYGSTVEDAQRKLCYDLYYLKHRSIDLDVAILIRTLGTFLLGSR